MILIELAGSGGDRDGATTDARSGRQQGTESIPFFVLFYLRFVLSSFYLQAKLLQITQANAAKLLQAQQNWEPKRIALMEGYRAEKDKFESERKRKKEKTCFSHAIVDRKLAAQDLLKEIDEMRRKAKELAADVQEKDQRYRNLLEGTK